MEHLYIAGPYSKPDPIVNTNAAIEVATILYDRRLFVPHVPHLTLLWHMVTPRTIDWWYALDIEHLSRCDAIVRLPGDSDGADREMKEAERLGKVIIPFMSLPPSAISTWRDRLL